MYGVEWLIGLAVLGLVLGLGGGYLLARQAGARGSRLRELEEQLTTARQELEDYRHEVVTQFSETARKFQTLNDSYTDLHQQLAKSSSILCGEVSGPLLAAPAGHQDLIPADIREDREEDDGRGIREPTARERTAPTEAASAAEAPAKRAAAEAERGATDPAASRRPPESPAAPDRAEHPAASSNASAAASAAGSPAAGDQPAREPPADAGSIPAANRRDEATQLSEAPASGRDEEPPTLRERVDRASRQQDATSPPVDVSPGAAPAPDGSVAPATPTSEGGNGRAAQRPGGSTPTPNDPGSEIRVSEPTAADAGPAAADGSADDTTRERHARGRG